MRLTCSTRSESVFALTQFLCVYRQSFETGPLTRVLLNLCYYFVRLGVPLRVSSTWRRAAGIADSSIPRCIFSRIGRRPVILMGLVGTGISATSFGLSKSFWAMVVARGLNGALNGNICVVKAALGEITDETNRGLGELAARLRVTFSLAPRAQSTDRSLSIVQPFPSSA